MRPYQMFTSFSDIGGRFANECHPAGHRTMKKAPGQFRRKQKRLHRHAKRRRETKAVTIDDIINVVCKHFDLESSAIHTKSRKREVVQARQVAMYLAKTHTDFSTSKIGKFIGNKDHATVLHACKTVKGQCEVDKSFRSDLENIETLLKKRNINSER